MAEKGSALKKPVTISAELTKIIGPGPMPRTEVTKKLWAYIKTHKRQDPNNMRDIIPDDTLAPVLGKKTINMFAMTKVVSKHIGS